MEFSIFEKKVRMKAVRIAGIVEMSNRELRDDRLIAADIIRITMTRDRCVK